MDKTTGIATGNEPESIYAVISGKHYNDGCCFDVRTPALRLPQTAAATKPKPPPQLLTLFRCPAGPVQYGNSEANDRDDGAGSMEVTVPSIPYIIFWPSLFFQHLLLILAS